MNPENFSSQERDPEQEMLNQEQAMGREAIGHMLDGVLKEANQSPELVSGSGQSPSFLG